MKEQLPVLIVIVPLIMSFITYILGIFWKRCVYPITFLTSGFCLFFNAQLLKTLLFSEKRITYYLGGWEPPWGIEYVVDYLNAPILTGISLVFFLLVILTKGIVEKEIREEKRNVFYSLLLLQFTGLQGVTVTGDMFNLYVLLEILSFSAYGIVGIGKAGSEFFAFRYMIFGTLGACSYLLGVGYLYILTGSLNMADLSNILPDLKHSTALFSGAMFLVLGVLIKMAFFPLHVWLPDAYSKAPSSVSVFLAALSTKALAYVLIRIVFTILGPTYSSRIIPVFDFLGYIAAFGVIFCGIMAIAQKEIVRSLCYILISEIGYIVLAISSWNADGLKGGVLHIINDMFMMGSLFSVWAIVESRTDKRMSEEWTGLRETFPYTMGIFAMSALSVIGVPPLCGFFSKWYILLGLMNAKKWVFSATIIVSSLLNAIYFFKLIEKIYLRPKLDRSLHGSSNMKRIEVSIGPESLSLYVLSAFLVFLGLINNYIVENIISHSIPGLFTW
jgi:multicomponent Na+:H+ antiporter subunit D